MGELRRILAVCRFELARSWTWRRAIVSLVLALFPPVMLGLITYYARLDGDAEAAEFFVFVMIFLVGLVCVLSLLLRASTNVYTELEEKSWIFVATRPLGRVSMILGKYLAAVLSSFAICVVAITLSMALGEQIGAFSDVVHSWLTTLATFGVATAAYAAVYSLIGAVFYRRAMVLAAGYTLLFELFLANVPALISRFTVRYHVQELGLRWIGWFPPIPQDDFRIAFPLQPMWIHWMAIVLFIGISLTVACLMVVHREFITADET